MKRLYSGSEDGAIAVISALVAIILIGFCAFAVDFGNAFARKRHAQSQADFAALAGANELGRGNTKSVGDPAVRAVADYLIANQPNDDDGGTPTTTAAMAAALVDGVDLNGEVYFTGDRMRVLTPRALVQYALAGVFGATDVEVQAEASVAIRSGGAIMPFFAVDGCDYGPQTISTPPPGPAPGLNLALPDNGTQEVHTLSPDAVALNTTPSPALTITGDKFTTGSGSVTKVGFFLNDGSTYLEVPATTTSNTQIDIPAGAISTHAPDVLTTEEVWYVRVYKGTKWSEIANAKPFRVGSAVMECVAGPSSGNFGSILLPRTDSNNSASGGWLPINIAQGLQEPLTLSVHAGAAGPSWNCTDGIAGAVTSSTTGTPTLVPGTNCLDTDTGLPDTSATAGFVTGGSNGITYPGRLDEDTTPGCGAQTSDRNARWDTTISAGPGPHSTVKVNDDLLTCFLDTGVSIATISQDSYAGPAVLDEDIYRSPRFFLQPVLGRPPTCGGCEKYSIVDFRPAFLTDQPTSATGGSTTLGTATTHNGLSIDAGKISKVRVVFFNMNALPPPPDDAPMSDYIGAGPKIIQLID